VKARKKDLLKTEKYEHLYQKKVMLSRGQLHVQTRVEISLILCNKKGRLYNELNVCYYLIKIYMFDTEMMLIFIYWYKTKKYIYTQ